MLVLAADGLDPLDLDATETEGYLCEQWTIGPPDVREVVVPRTLANGTIDRTAYVGSRAVSLTVVAFPSGDRSVQGQLDRLRAFCRPELRPTLTWQVDSDDPRTVTLRAAPGLDVEWSRTDWRRVGLSFVAPDGLIFAGDWTGSGAEVRVIPPSAGAETGRRYDEVPTGRVYDRDYPQSNVANVTIVNPGDIAVPWVARIYGPCTNPALYNDTLGRALILSANGGLTLAAGQAVIFDSQARTITVDGASRYNRLDVTTSQWWSLAPGDNTIRYVPATFSAASECQFVWRHAWL